MWSRGWRYLLPAAVMTGVACGVVAHLWAPKWLTDNAATRDARGRALAKSLALRSCYASSLEKMADAIKAFQMGLPPSSTSVTAAEIMSAADGFYRSMWLKSASFLDIQRYSTGLTVQLTTGRDPDGRGASEARLLLEAEEYQWTSRSQVNALTFKLAELWQIADTRPSDQRIEAIHQTLVARRERYDSLVTDLKEHARRYGSNLQLPCEVSTRLFERDTWVAKGPPSAGPPWKCPSSGSVAASR